jgi:segregation and condensation protein B
LEREWIKAVGHRDVPGRPAIFATTKEFLGYFGLKTVGDLPALPELTDLEAVHEQFDNIAGGGANSVENSSELESLDSGKIFKESVTAQ